MATLMLVSAAACGGSSSTAPSSSQTQPAQTEAVSQEEAGSTEAPAADEAQPAATGKVQSPEDLAGAKIGVQEGTTGDLFVTDDFEADYPDSIFRYKTAFEAVQALKTGKIDCVVVDDQVAKNFVNTTDGLTILDATYVTEEYALYINKDEADLYEQVNAAIKELQENGTIDNLVKYYIEEDESAPAYHEQTSEEFPNGDLEIAVNPYFDPYCYYEGEDIWGIDADMCRAIGDIIGMKVTYSDMEFTASLAAVQTGKCKMAMGGITATEERAQKGNFTDTYFTGKQVIIVTAE